MSHGRPLRAVEVDLRSRAAFCTAPSTSRELQGTEMFQCESLLSRRGTWNTMVVSALTRRRTYGPHLEHAPFHSCHLVFHPRRRVLLRHAANSCMDCQKKGISSEYGSGSFRCHLILHWRFLRCRYSSWSRQSLWRAICWGAVISLPARSPL